MSFKPSLALALAASITLSGCDQLLQRPDSEYGIRASADVAALRVEIEHLRADNVDLREQVAVLSSDLSRLRETVNNNADVANSTRDIMNRNSRIFAERLGMPPPQ